MKFAIVSAAALLSFASGAQAASAPVTYTFDIQLRGDTTAFFDPIFGGTKGGFARGSITFTPQSEDEGVENFPGGWNRFYPNQPFSASLTFEGATFEIINSTVPGRSGYDSHLTVADVPMGGATFDDFDITGLTTPITYRASTGGDVTEVLYSRLFWGALSDTISNKDASTINFEKVARGAAGNPTYFTLLEIAGVTSGRRSYGYLSNVQRAGAVPEPAAWALMIAGLGLAGAQFRQRRTTNAFTVRGA